MRCISARGASDAFADTVSMGCAQLGTEKRKPGPKPRQLGRAEMTKARDREDRISGCRSRFTEVSTLKLGGFTARLMIRHPLKSCPLPRALGRTIPGSGTHREPPTEGATMRFEKLFITQPTERTGGT
jgi:hypothetical protein